MDVWCVCVCIRLFCVCVVLCLDRGLATSWSHVQEALLPVKWSQNWEISPMPRSWSNSRRKRKKNCHGKLRINHLAKKFPTFYGTKRFITTFTKGCPWSIFLYQRNPIDTLASNYFKIHFNIILPSVSSIWDSGFFIIC
jgi:hypothetical protein